MALLFLLHCTSVRCWFFFRSHRTPLETCIAWNPCINGANVRIIVSIIFIAWHFTLHRFYESFQFLQTHYCMCYVHSVIVITTFASRSTNFMIHEMKIGWIFFLSFCCFALILTLARSLSKLFIFMAVHSNKCSHWIFAKKKIKRIKHGKEF